MTVNRCNKSVWLSLTLGALAVLASCTGQSMPRVEPPDEEIPKVEYQWARITSTDPYYDSASELVELQSLGQPVAGILVSGQSRVTVLQLAGGQLEWQGEMDWPSRFGWFGVGELPDRLYVQVDEGVAELDESGFPLDNPPSTVEDSRIFYGSFAIDSYGFPVAAWEAYPGRLHFARSEGSPDHPIWQQGQSVLHIPGGESEYNRAAGAHMITLANGTLMITYAGEGGLNAVRSLDKFGDSWGEPEVLKPLGTGFTLQRGTVEHIMVDGKPQLIYYGSGLFFMRALNEAATEWSVPLQLAPGSTNTVFARAALIELQGRPVVAYEYQGVQLVQAKDRLGSAWGEPLVVDPTGYGRISMQVIGDKLHLSYMSGDRYASKPTLSIAKLDGSGFAPVPGPPQPSPVLPQT